MLQLWHVTSQEIAESICELGFTFFGKHHLFDPNAEGKFANTDAGYFDSGIYFSDSPSFAAKYSKENILMLAFIAIRTPFPIVGDFPILPNVAI